MPKFISNYEKACAKLKKSATLPDVSGFDDYLQKHLVALHKITRILEYNNGLLKYKANIADTDQMKYYPWFWVKDKGPLGFGLSYRGYGCADSLSSLGGRLACGTSELAKFMGEECTALYEELHA